MFVDQGEVEVVAGHGGDGGNGGSVIIVAKPGVDSLSALMHRKHWKAKNGSPGGGAQCHGASADDLVIRVPPGTIVHDVEHDFVLKDLAQEDDELVVARGGYGGKGNVRFKSATNRAPRQSTPGGEGEARRVRFELKIIADVGLVGKPNAGKSTLLSRLSRARPEIAAYPFTTKYPNLGRVQLDLDHSFIMADIPGLIEGAHAGVGLGHEFLRHVQRAGILVHLVEPLPTDGTDPLENYHSIRDELEKYDQQLGARPEIVAVTKADLPEAEDVRKELDELVEGQVFLISAVTGQSLNQLVGAIAQALNEQKHGGEDSW